GREAGGAPGRQAAPQRGGQRRPGLEGPARRGPALREGAAGRAGTLAAALHAARDGARLQGAEEDQPHLHRGRGRGSGAQEEAGEAEVQRAAGEGLGRAQWVRRSIRSASAWASSAPGTPSGTRRRTTRGGCTRTSSCAST